MNIYAKEGTKLIYNSEHVCDASVKWGSHDDPRDVLVDGAEYTVLRTEVHSYHTKLYLKEFPLLKLNTVWFRDETDPPKQLELF